VFYNCSHLNPYLYYFGQGSKKYCYSAKRNIAGQ